MEHMESALLILPADEMKTPAEMRDKIVALEAAMMAMPAAKPGEFGRIEIKTTHHFGPGIYMREIYIPKGTTLTGKIHKTEHLNILSQGDLSVETEGGVKRLKASTVILSQPGIKRVGYAHEDSVWITVHKNTDESRDVDMIEERLVVDTFEEFDLASGRTFETVLAMVGLTRDEMQALSEFEGDQVPFPSDQMGVSIGASVVHGKGVFATRTFEKGEFIAPARIGQMRTPAGRYCNHGADPNAEMVLRQDGSVGLVAIKSIADGAELLTDYYYNFVNTRPSIGQAITGGK